MVFLLAFVSQLAVLIRFSHSESFVNQGSDMAFYSDWALRIAHGQWSDGKAFYGLPGYAYLLAALYTVLGGFDPFSIGLIQAGLFALVAVLIHRLALLAFTPEPGAPLATPRLIGWLAALGWTVFVPAQAFSVILMPTVWAVLTYWATVGWLMKTRQASVARPWIWIGLLMGAVSMVVATILMLTPMVLFTIWRSVAINAPWQKRLPRVLAAGLIFAIGVLSGSAPASLHNHLLAHEPVMLSAHSGINFWIGNHPGATGYPKMPPGIRASQTGLLKDSILLAEAEAGHPLSRAEVSAYWSAKAHRYIAAHPGEWIRLLGRKLANFWNALQYDDLSFVALMQSAGVIGFGLRFGSVAALGAAGLLLAGRKNPGARWIIAGLLMHIAALLPVFVTERYRLAAVPGLLLLGAWWMVSTWVALANRRWLQATLLVGCASLSAWFVSLPGADASFWALDHYRAGIQATDSGDLDRAQTELEIAQRYSPFNAETQFAMGNLWLKRGNPTVAKSHYRRALELDPKNDGALNNLGVLALEEKRWQLAEVFLLRALAADPDDAKRHFLLARARFGRGAWAQARTAVEAALRFKPNQPQFLDLLKAITEKQASATAPEPMPTPAP
jgi:Tfp pilus assembly protein PilF